MASKSKSQTSQGNLKPGVRTLLLLLALAATGVAGYLAWVSFSGRDVVGCGPESGCAAVLNSRWAYWLGMPVSIFGGLSYVAVFLGVLRLTPRVPAAQQRKVWTILLLLAWLILGAALWFVVLQIAVIKQFCPFCMSTHVAALAISILILRHCPYGPEPSSAKEKDRQIYVTPASVKKLFVPAACGLALLATGQLVSPKKSFVDQSASGVMRITTNAAPSTGMVAQTESAIASTTDPTTTTQSVAAAATFAPPPSEYRSISLFNGQLEFDLVDVPIIGRADAPHVIIGLHDYTCKGCRAMHKPLMDLYRKYSNELAIVSLPLPLDADCNPLVPKTPPAHVDACQYAKISLAVWRANPSVLPEFDDWVFAPEHPPSVAETQKFARELVGDQAFAEAWNDPIVDRQLKIDIALYGLNYQMNKRSSMPQFFIGNSVLFGSMPADELERKVVQEFGLKPASTP